MSTSAIVDEELWNAVQARLSANLMKRRQARIESGALLAGLIFDDRGNRMSPTYTVRRGNRYRYYISQAQLRGGEPGTRPVVEMVVEGNPNKQIAYVLGISQRTVETHRATAMKKVGARTLSELIHLTIAGSPQDT